MEAAYMMMINNVRRLVVEVAGKVEDSCDFFFIYVYREVCIKQSLLNLSESKSYMTLSIFIYIIR